jgi:ribonuclease HII
MKDIEEAYKFDRSYWSKGFYPLAGIDEAGRGALFGPVVAAAVVLQKDRVIPDFCDSKAISAKRREQLFSELVENGHLFSVGIVEAEEIDKINILKATLKAMEIAFKGIEKEVRFALVDGNVLPDLKCRCECVVKGDKKSISVGAASIVAKVVRDRLIMEMDGSYPEYGLRKNKGYGTREHIVAIYEKGVTPFHRRSFKPVSEIGNGLWR